MFQPVRELMTNLLLILGRAVLFCSIINPLFVIMRQSKQDCKQYVHELTNKQHDLVNSLSLHDTCVSRAMIKDSSEGYIKCFHIIVSDE